MAILNLIFINIPWDVIRNIGAFIFVLGLLVLVHELGHFTVAKLNNMHVYQFCIGLGPKLIKFKGKETTYAICALPIGGMVDLREDENDPENLRSFSAKKPWQRLLVIVAGAFMNFVLAIILMIGIFSTIGFPTDSNELGEVPQNLPSYQAGLRPGDKIISIEGKEVNEWDDITDIVVQESKSTFKVVYSRNGIENEVTIQAYLDQDGYYKIGVGPVYKKNFFEAVKYGFEDFLDKSTLIFDGFIQLITRQIDPDAVSGPVGIYKQVGEVAESNDFRNLLYFTALLSINLGIFNLLPFPFLDGGRAVFIIYEIIMRKPVDREKEAFVHFLGMVALMVLMVVLVFKDLNL